MLVCRVFGHRWHFSAQGATMHWDMARAYGPGDGGTA